MVYGSSPLVIFEIILKMSSNYPFWLSLYSELLWIQRFTVQRTGWGGEIYIGIFCSNGCVNQNGSICSALIYFQWTSIPYGIVSLESFSVCNRFDIATFQHTTYLKTQTDINNRRHPRVIAINSKTNWTIRKWN